MVDSFKVKHLDDIFSLAASLQEFDRAKENRDFHAQAERKIQDLVYLMESL